MTTARATFEAATLAAEIALAGAEAVAAGASVGAVSVLVPIAQGGNAATYVAGVIAAEKVRQLALDVAKQQHRQAITVARNALIAAGDPDESF